MLATRRKLKGQEVSHSVVYLNDLGSELKGFETKLTRMREIKKGGFAVSDDMITKMYLPQAK